MGDNLRRIELGSLELAEGADVVTFLISEGRRDQREAVREPGPRSVGKLCDEYLASLLKSSIEPTTEHCLRIHIGHLKRVLGEGRRLVDVGPARLQAYVDCRSKNKGRQHLEIQRIFGPRSDEPSDGVLSEADSQ